MNLEHRKSKDFSIYYFSYRSTFSYICYMLTNLNGWKTLHKHPEKGVRWKDYFYTDYLDNN